MDVVMNDVRLLVKKELVAANKKFPMFSSAHEGWAVIREELQEVKDDHYMLEQYLENRLWNEVRYNNEIPKEAQHRAVHMAVEAIQTAAMICKLERSQRRGWRDGKKK